MAKQITKGLTMLGLMVTLAFVTAVTSANAQSTRRQTADIPFDFVVGDKNLPAGKYDVHSMTAAGEALRIRGIANEKSVVRLSNPITRIEPAQKGQLVFHRYGNQYFLSEVWTAGMSNGRQLLKSAAEKALQREVAGIPSKSDSGQSGYERIVIALVRQ
jgi:hypothetical protein